MKKILLKSLLLLVVLAGFSAENTKAVASNDAPTKKIKRALARAAEKVLHLPTREMHYLYNESGKPELTVIYRYEYNALGDVTLNVALLPTLDTLSKTISKYDETNGREISTISYVRDFEANDLIPESRDTFFYDNQNKLVKYLSQVYAPDTKEWINETQTEISYSSPSLLYPDSYVTYDWINDQWIKSSEGYNLVWADYKDYEFTSGTFIEYKNTIDDNTYRVTLSTDESGVQVGIYAQLEEDQWIDLTKSTITKDAAGNLTEIIQTIDGDNISKQTSLVDEKGADAGYIYEAWINNQLIEIQYYKYLNTYNDIDELIQSEREAYNVNGEDEIVKTLILYSAFVDIITGIKEKLATDISTSHFSYPNPGRDVLNIENPSHETMEISIINMQNNPVFSGTIDAGKGSISIKDLPAGMYILKSTTSSGKIYTEKIIKE